MATIVADCDVQNTVTNIQDSGKETLAVVTRQDLAMTTKSYNLPDWRNMSGQELLALPIAQQRAILAICADMAESDYLGDPDLTAFETLDDDDIYDETP